MRKSILASNEFKTRFVALSADDRKALMDLMRCYLASLEPSEEEEQARIDATAAELLDDLDI